MRRVLLALALTGALLMGGYSVAQTTGDLAPKMKKDQAPPAPVTVPLSVGTAFNTTLVDMIDTRKAKPGDLVTASIAEDVSYEQSLVFPKGTKVVGHIVRSTSGGHGRTGSALFIQFDKAVLQEGEDVILNAGIQALAVNAVASPVEGNATPDNQDKPSASEAMIPAEERAPTTEAATAAEVVSTVYDARVRRLRDPLSPLPQREIDSNGLFTPDSTGAFGRPDLKVYTPTSDGSHGTVLISSKKNMHLDSGTHMLLVVQPPPSGDKAKTVDLDGIDQP